MMLDETWITDVVGVKQELNVSTGVFFLLLFFIFIARIRLDADSEKKHLRQS